MTVYEFARGFLGELDDVIINVAGHHSLLCLHKPLFLWELGEGYVIIS